MAYSSLELLQCAWCIIWMKLRVALGQRLFSNYWGKSLPYSKKFQFFFKVRWRSIHSYNRNPRHLQSVIKRVFELATSKVQLPGVNIVPVPLFEALDGLLAASLKWKDTR